MASILGFDGMRMLKANPTERLLYYAMLEAAQDWFYKLQKRQAGLIASEVSKMFKR